MTMVNPVIKRMAKAGEVAESGEKTASYRGIGIKTAFFILVTFIGVVVYFVLHNQLAPQADTSEVFRYQESIFDLVATHKEMAILVVVALVALIFPWLAWLIRPLVFLNGTIYCLAQGYLIAFVTSCLKEEYRYLAVLAMVFTIALVSVMLFLYAQRIVRVTQRFRTIITTLFLTCVFGGLILFVLQLIPGVKNLVSGLQGVMDNPIVSIISSVIFIVIATLFLLADFDAIEKSVENKLPKKREWMAAFGLAYTIIYLYFKILNLLVTIFANKSEAN